MPQQSVPNVPLRPLLLYHITDRKQFPGDPEEQERRLLGKIRECAEAGVDYIQLREKDLTGRELEQLAYKAVAAIPAGSQSKLLINSRSDVALACGAHGVHLPANDLPADHVRALFHRASGLAPLIGVSCHSLKQVNSAEAHGADFVVFAPVFEKCGKNNPTGLEELRQVCHRSQAAAMPIPVLALGGITLQNAGAAIHAGAAGIAGIRLFQENNVELIAATLRALAPISHH